MFTKRNDLCGFAVNEREAENRLWITGKTGEGLCVAATVTFFFFFF